MLRRTRRRSRWGSGHKTYERPVLEGDANGAPHPDAAAYRPKFSGRYTHRIDTGGVDHNLPQEAPRAFADAVIEVDGF